MAILKVLVDNGADINTADDRSWTPLMVAVSKSYCDIVKFLIVNKANVDKRDKFGKRALDRATDEEIFFMLTSKSMTNRIKQGMNLQDDCKFVRKSWNVENSELKCKKIVHDFEFENDFGISKSLERLPQTTKAKSSKYTSQKISSDDKVAVDSVLRKNLSKLKNQFVRLSDKAIEDNVMNEVLDKKNDMIQKIKIATNKMSKKMLK